MKTYKLKLSDYAVRSWKLEYMLIAVIMLLVWCCLPDFLRKLDANVGLLDQGIWQLLLLAVICFLIMLSLSWYILSRFLNRIGFGTINNIALHFNTLETWQQFGFYWASFALLLLAAVGCLVAVF